MFRRFVFGLALAAGCAAPSGTTLSTTRPTADPPALTIDDLNHRPITGRLGVPLGTLVTIDATVISGSSIGSKGAQGQYLLRVDRVDGRPLSPPPVLEFYTMFVDDRMPTHVLDWSDDRRNGGERSTTAPTADQLRTLEGGYVGRSFHVRAYEVGQFSGAPTNLRDVYWQDHGFLFGTALAVVDQKT